MAQQNRRPSPSARQALGRIAIAFVLAGAPTAVAADGAPVWQPEASERLVKLPANLLKKTLDADFAESELGLAIVDVEGEIGFKQQTLGDLATAAGQAGGELRTELRHQLLAEKRDYIELVSHKNDLRRQHLETQAAVFEDMLSALTRATAGDASPARVELIALQDAARSRFESSLASADARIFESVAAPQSQYAKDYSANLAAIEQLFERIRNHPMNDAAAAGQPRTKEDQIRRMLADSQAQLAILDQDETILGYMAKLVALDAMALAEEGLDAELTDSDLPGSSRPASAVGFFLRN